VLANGHSFAYVAHLVFLGDVWSQTQRTAVESRCIAIALTQWGDGGGAGGEGGQGGGEGGGHGRLRQQLVRYRRPAQWTSPLNLHISLPKTKLVKRDSSVRWIFRSLHPIKDRKKGS